MNWSEITPVITIVASVVGGITTILTIVVWPMRRHARSLQRQIAQARRDRDEAVKQLKTQETEHQAKIAHAEAFHAKVNHDWEAARKELIELKASVKPLQERLVEVQEKYRKNAKAAKHYFDECESQKTLLVEATKHETELVVKANDLGTALSGALARLDAAQKAVVEAHEAGEIATKQRDKARDDLAARASEAMEQQNALEAHRARIKSIAEHNGRVWLTPLLKTAPEFVSLEKRRTRIISVLNLKGGVGKTTLTANLGAYLAACHEKWVLMLDLDHQRSLTQLILSTSKRRTAANDGNTIQDFLLSTRTGKELRKAAIHLEAEGLPRCWLLGNSDAEPGFGTEHNLDDVEMSLLARWLVDPTEPDIRYLMRPALHSTEIRERFEYVLIDCPPRLTTACINALAASDYVLIPTEAEQVSARSVPHLLRRLRELHREKILPDLRILGIVANMVSAEVDRSTSLEAKVLRETEGLAMKAWGESVRMLEAKIRASDTYSTAQRDIDAKGLSLPGVGRVREQYKKLAEEIERLIT